MKLPSELAPDLAMPESGTQWESLHQGTRRPWGLGNGSPGALTWAWRHVGSGRDNDRWRPGQVLWRRGLGSLDSSP